MSSSGWEGSDYPRLRDRYLGSFCNLFEQVEIWHKSLVPNSGIELGGGGPCSLSAASGIVGMTSSYTFFSYSFILSSFCLQALMTFSELAGWKASQGSRSHSLSKCLPMTTDRYTQPLERVLTLCLPQICFPGTSRKLTLIAYTF